MKVHVSASQLSVTLQDDLGDPEAFSEALRHVAYVDTRAFPSPGQRIVQLRTNVTCYGEGPCMEIPDVEVVVVVPKPPEPRITLW
uniref:Calsyntenin-3-like n=1 Tax=Petromyzon marinus TaxID=7757 RepID=A0AAJ7UK51_PETMA|nr:calsyntenin-3-like [Petromyzon marinus]